MAFGKCSVIEGSSTRAFSRSDKIEAPEHRLRIVAQQGPASLKRANAVRDVE
jgi:hypothetical protein